MLDIFVRKPLASRALRESHSLAQRSIICFAVGCVKRVHREAAFDADHEGVLLRIIIWVESKLYAVVVAALTRPALCARLVICTDGAPVESGSYDSPSAPRTMESVGSMST